MSTTRVWAEIDLAVLRQNARALITHAGGRAALMAVVKANAYGHGLEEIVSALAGIASIFAVANPEEARCVAKVAPNADILLLGSSLPSERAGILAAGMIPTISSLEEAKEFAAIAGNQPFRVHCKIDTGMGRTGIWHTGSPSEIRAICAIPGLELHSISTHLAAADEDIAFTLRQFADFDQAISQIRDLVDASKLHVLNSSGTIRFPAASADLIRVGLALYGISPVPEFPDLVRPILQWKTRVASIRQMPAGRTLSYGATFTTTRPTDVAALTIGYGDGYPRSLSGSGAEVLIHGKRCRVLGRVTMDQILVDATGVDNVAPGDEAILIGNQGTESITASELATRSGTIPWEILTRIGGRTRRIYCESDDRSL